MSAERRSVLTWDEIRRAFKQSGLDVPDDATLEGVQLKVQGGTGYKTVLVLWRDPDPKPKTKVWLVEVWNQLDDRWERGPIYSTREAAQAHMDLVAQNSWASLHRIQELVVRR